MLRDAGSQHIQNVAALPRLIRDAARGFARVQAPVTRARRPARYGQDVQGRRRRSSTTWSPPLRTFATASLALADVKETAKHLGVTFNDIVLAMAAGGLRELLLRYDGRSDQPILASVPVATDKSTERDHR